jgi:hypothetical protein
MGKRFGTNLKMITILGWIPLFSENTIANKIPIQFNSTLEAAQCDY